MTAGQVSGGLISGYHFSHAFPIYGCLIALENFNIKFLDPTVVDNVDIANRVLALRLSPRLVRYSTYCTVLEICI